MSDTMARQSYFSDYQERQLTISDFYVEKIKRNRGREFIMEHHYSGGCGVATMSWGLFHRPTEELVGVCAFQTPISENVRRSIFGGDDCHCDHIQEEHQWHSHVTELHRLATVDACPKNTESWFISRSLKALKRHKPKYWGVVSFADSTEGHQGTIYQASNAIYYGTTGTETFYRDKDGNLRPPRNCGVNVSKEEALSRGWSLDKRDAKHRYLFLLPDPGHGGLDRDELQDRLEIETQEYPSDDLVTEEDL